MKRHEVFQRRYFFFTKDGIARRLLQQRELLTFPDKRDVARTE